MLAKTIVDTAILDGIIKKLSTESDLSVGVRGGKEPNGQDLVDVAIYNEYGTQHIPARPFLRTAEQKYHGKWISFLAKEISKTFDGKNSLDRLGVIMESDVKLNIKNGNWTPNTPETIKRKGSAKPLIDTGQLLRAITHEVIKK